MAAETHFAQPRYVSSIEECYFYHTMELPGHGLVQGEWDLRSGIRDYLGHVDVRGKRVLDVGAASGFLSFSMEQWGAEVISYDLSPEDEWDIVPYARLDYRKHVEERKMHLQRIDNAFWFARRILDSQVNKAYGTVYNIPPAVGEVDVSVFGSILLHLRDPFLGLQGALERTREAVIVTDLARRRSYLPLLDRLDPVALRFIPNYRETTPVDGWWILTPELCRRFLGVLGFEDTTTTFHFQPLHGQKQRLFTVVGRRTQPMPL